MTDLPLGWETARLEEIAEVRLGRQRSPKHHTGANMRPYMRAANVDWRGLKLDDVKEMNFTEEELEIYRLQPGDLILSEASGSAGEVGKPALWNGEIENCCFQNTLLRVRTSGVDSKYLLHFFRYEALRGAFGEGARGVGIHHLGAAKLAKWLVPIPPLPEQRRIITNLERHLSHLELVDRAVESSTRKVKQLKKRILIEAVPIPGPSSWKMAKVDEVGKVDLGRQRHPDWHSGPNMRPYLRVANVFEDRIDTSNLMEMDFPPDIFDRFRLSEGDILLNEGQSPEYLGRPAMYRGEPKEVAFTNSLLRFRAGPEVDPEWALLVFRRHLHAGRFMQETRITTNIAHLSASRFKSVEFPVPPLEKQREIAKQVARKLADVDLLASQIRRVEEHAGALRTRLLADAFSGRLVHQNPIEEPAAELLKRIQAQREALRAKRPRHTARASRAGSGDLAQMGAGGGGFTGTESSSVPSTTVGAGHTGKQEALFQQEGLTA
ncbi:restriction endonuclease subunit S [Sphaerimonospora mesophila]|uniref:restriction endonuclease subunit S n=1 Tax=Sphaerimonospora mesophila TaxID=37483 RepID=UPI0009FB1484